MTDITLEPSISISSRSLIFQVTWAAPQINENISQYIVQYKKTGNSKWNNQDRTQGSETNVILSRLDPGSNYSVRVKAKFFHGEGPWSAVHTARTFASKYFNMHHLPSSSTRPLVVPDVLCFRPVLFIYTHHGIQACIMII